MHADDALERRIVTVLFADLVGFTTLSEQFDAEDIAAVQDRYFAAVRETIGRYGGQLEKFIGDAAMAVFGVPRARDDDAERAVRAGFALVHAVQQLGAGLGLDDDALRLRVGINTGETVVAGSGADEGRVTGDTVNTAARFQAAAPPGGVLIGESTALAVAEIAELGAQQLLELKGKAAPTPARLVTGFRAEPSREQAMGHLRAPTLGRDDEVAQISEALERTGGGALERWLVVAPPGVGKSRLLREIAERGAARPDTAVWRARARPGSVSPFETIAELMASALGNVGPEATETALRNRLAAALPGARAGVVADAVQSLIQPHDGEKAARPPSEDRDALFTAWLDALDALADRHAQMWLIEDVHWAGGDVLAFVDLASERAVPAGRLIVVTARPSLLEARPAWSEDDAPAGRRVMRLGTLEPADARGLIAALVGDALPDTLAERVVSRSDGNCLFIEELLRTWVSVGALARDDASPGRWRLAVAAEDIPLPQSVQQIYAAQLDDLPPDARRVARRASIAGRRFPARALEPLDAGDAGLEPLRRRDLVSGPITEPLLGEAFAYRHALLRDAGYASLARAERARLHARLARWLEQAAGERGAEIAEQIAGHYAAALESAPALAATVDGELSRDTTRTLAADWYERAAQAALALSAHEAARQLFRRSIELTRPADVLAQARRWERLGDATAFAADMTEGAAAYEKAIELYRAARATGPAQEAVGGAARAGTSLAQVMYEQLRFDDSRDLADRLIAELADAYPSARPRLLVARAMGGLGGSGPSDAVAADLGEAATLVEYSADEELKLRVRHASTVYLSEIGQATARDWNKLAQEAARFGTPRMATSAAINAAMYVLDDAPRRVTELLEPVREIAVAHGLTEATGWIGYLEAEEAFAAGDWNRALALGSDVIDLGIANDYLRVTVRTVHIVVPVASVRGEMEVLRRCQDWYASLLGKFEFPDSPYSRIMRAAQDLELADAGLRDRYTPDPGERIASFKDDPNGPSWTSALDRVVRSWVEARLLDEADRALDAMAAAIDRATSTGDLGVGTYELMRARVLAARGDTASALSAAARALASLRISDAPWWMAKAMRLIERAGGADEALVAEVERIEHRLGATRPTQ